LVALITQDNDYQQEQAATAESSGRDLNLDVKIVFAGNDSVEQSLQLVKAIQSTSGTRPDAIVVEPVGTTMPQVAHAAAEAGIGWIVLNRTAEYVTQLRRISSAPVFTVGSNNEEIGRIQGEQFNKLIPKAGSLLYIEGPSASEVTRQRTVGMLTSKRGDLVLRVLKGDWTEASAYHAVTSWLRLSTSREATIQAIGCQNDAMALGARRAIQDVAAKTERDKLLQLPFTGCDGLPAKGQAHVRAGTLTATVVVPPLTKTALELLVSAVRNKAQPPEHTFTCAKSYPAVSELKLAASV
jgi:ribose transport system substrate-binding protein